MDDRQSAAEPSELFTGLALPLICAPMFLVSGPDLVAAARLAGIVGALPAATHRTSQAFASALDQIDGAVGDARSPGPLAVNLSFGGRRRLGAERFEADLDVCRRRRVPLVITSSGDPTAIIPEIHAWGGRIFHDVTTMRHARKAIEAGVDGLVLVCGGGGGHAGRLNPFTFLPEVRRIFDGTIVLAGALSTGEAILAAQTLGADLCYMGTRFIATRESLAPEDYKIMIVRSGSHEVTYTGAFTGGVPASFLARRVEALGLDPDRPPPAAELAVPRPWRDIWSAGQGVGLIDDVPTVAELVARLRTEYRAALLKADRLGTAFNACG